MKGDLTEAQLAFQSEVRQFLAEKLPADIARKVKHGHSVSKDELTVWTRILDEQGWAAPHWPEEYGGRGWSLIERHIFDVECRAAHAPPLSGFGFNMVGPAIAKFGSSEQKEQFLPAIRSAQLWWCQGYSEPQAGSDLAAVRTTAVRDGDDYIVNGQKIWTSAAESADWIFALVRTDASVQKQKGISFLLIDMNTPGVQVEPLYAFNGKRLWNQVFFDNVRVPVANRLGEENRGWTVAKSLLGDERLMVSRVSENKRLLGRIADVLQQAEASGVDTGEFAARVSMLSIRLQALEMTSLRILSQADSGQVVGAEPSMLKLKGSELVQAMDQLLFDAVGYWALPRDRAEQGDAPIGPEYAQFIASGRYHHRGYTIAGGSSEVQHNIIAKQVLGL